MIEQGKISYKQLISIIVLTISPTAILYLPTITYKEAKQDGWISILIVTIYAFLVAYIIISLNKMFEGKTIIQYSEEIVGKYCGKVISFLYCVLYIHLNATVIREFSEVLAGPFMPETPLLFFTIGIMLPSMYGVYKGIEVIARTAQIIFPIFLGAVIIIILLGIRDMNFSRLQPILAEGYEPVLKGASRQISWFSQTIILTIITPFTNLPKKIGKMTYIAIIIVSIMIILVNISIVATFGEEVELMNYPVLSYARYISAIGFIERLDSIILFLWIGGVFIKIVILHYCSVIAVSQLFEIKDYRILSVPVGVIFIILSNILWGSLTELKEIIKLINVPYNTMVQAGIPTILIVIEKIKRRFVHNEK
ncbi:GerAB/ArcD/ProY family transporter [Vallitalea maricola]|uniref:Endospore germination permease n=1 Tax=Vallitalea maricola TaxID=3074433 RepID=A0ACB5UJT3_9FIRM|nr:endospore germination permease [Vallitalea sp. AN17-2]